MARPRGSVSFNENLCKGCSLCTTVCPVRILTLDRDRTNAQGYNPAGVTEAERCTGCTNCALTCPDLVITVEKY